MKNLTIIFSLIIFNTTMFVEGQDVSGEIIYGVTVTEKLFDKKTQNKNNTNKLISSFIEESKNIEFSLLFNKHESYYTISRTMEINDLKTKMAQIYFGGNNAHYLNKKENKNFSFVNAYGDFFRVKGEPYVWKITKDKKKIGNYLCHKATTTKIVENQKGEFVNEVVAWYAKDIPLNYGPRDYSGLPGLILELQEGKQTIFVKKIELNPQEKIKIVEPTKGKLISNKQFLEIGSKITH